MADIIQVLPPLICNQIAAGEVIERPASIIKELLENSLDAGSTDIVVNIKKSGNNFISVRDNGLGISKNDLPLAIRQHATSKLKSLADLDNITSLGFRGEALASICAVAKVQITSRQVDNDTAYSLVVDHESPENFRILEDAHPIGTTITVQDLFYSTPVRRRFLKADKTELIHIIDIFQKLALSNFNCNFTLIDEDKPVYKLINTNNTQRVQKIFGKSFIDNAVFFTTAGQGIKLEGWIGNSNYHRSQTDQQYFFLNNRIIRDKLILHAVKYVYETLIPDGRHPCYILYLTIDPDQFDINVHPTKHEVRFYDARWIHQFITQQLSKILLNNIQESADNNCDQNKSIDRDFVSREKFYGTAKLNIPAILNKVQVNKTAHNSYIGLFDKPIDASDTPRESAHPKYNLGEIIADINNSLIVSVDKTHNNYYLVDLANSYKYLAWQDLKRQWQANKSFSSFNLGITVYDVALSDLTQDVLSKLAEMGVVIKDSKITAIPSVLQFADPKNVVKLLIAFVTQSDCSDEILLENLANLALGRLEGNLLLSEQVDILDRLANLPYHNHKFNSRYLFKQLLPANLENFLSCNAY